MYSISHSLLQGRMYIYQVVSGKFYAKTSNRKYKWPLWNIPSFSVVFKRCSFATWCRRIDLNKRHFLFLNFFSMVLLKKYDNFHGWKFWLYEWIKEQGVVSLDREFMREWMLSSSFHCIRICTSTKYLYKLFYWGLTTLTS